MLFVSDDEPQAASSSGGGGKDTGKCVNTFMEEDAPTVLNVLSPLAGADGGERVKCMEEIKQIELALEF